MDMWKRIHQPLRKLFDRVTNPKIASYLVRICCQEFLYNNSENRISRRASFGSLLTFRVRKDLSKELRKNIETRFAELNCKKLTENRNQDLGGLKKSKEGRASETDSIQIKTSEHEGYPLQLWSADSCHDMASEVPLSLKLA